MMEGYHLEQSGPKLFASKGIDMVQAGGIDVPALSNGADGQVVLEPQPLQLTQQPRETPGRLLRGAAASWAREFSVLGFRHRLHGLLCFSSDP